MTGTTGNVLIDALSAPATSAVDTGSLDFWSDGLPVGFVTANFVTQASLRDAVWDATLEDTYTAKQLMRLLSAVAQGDATGLESGNPVFKSIDGTKDRVEATYSGGTRTVSSRDVT